MGVPLGVTVLRRSHHGKMLKVWPTCELSDMLQTTAETVLRLQHQHAADVAALQHQLQLLAALTHPDPPPQPWQLNLRAEALKYFLTELDPEATPATQGDPAGLTSQGPAKPKLFAAGLGLGPDVPKFLRWDEAVELHDVSLQELEGQVRVERACLGGLI